jgi:DNA-binding MarR family transcriptional regulator
LASLPEPAGEPPPTHDWTTGLDLPDVGLVARIVRLNMLVTRLLDEITSSAGIAPSDYLVLAVLRRSPHHRSSPTRLCELLGRSSGGMTLTIDRLEAAGWLTRAADPDDRRRVIITLSDAGVAISTRVNNALHGWEETLGLPPDRRAETIRMADHLLSLFESAASDRATTDRPEGGQPVDPIGATASVDELAGRR